MFVFNIFLRNIIQNQLYTNYKSKTTTKPPSYPYNERNLGYLFPSIVRGHLLFDFILAKGSAQLPKNTCHSLQGDIMGIIAHSLP